jgi:hypothetical protein
VMVRTLTVCVIAVILAFIILQFETVVCLVLNYNIEVSANVFSDAEHMYFPNVFFPYKVCKSMHHHTFEINQPTRYNNFSSLLLDLLTLSPCIFIIQFSINQQMHYIIK